MSNINFDNPYLLLIAVPLIVLFTVPFVIAVRKDNRNGHNIASMLMHVVLAVIIGFAAAGTTITSVLTETQVYVVADVSYSAHKNLDTIDKIIKDKLVLPTNSKVGIVAFGKEPELLCGLGEQKAVTSVKKSKVDDSETNIAEALRYAGNLFDRDDVIKRVVLITDGRQTDQIDTTAMRRAVNWLVGQKHVKVDAYFLDDNLNSTKQPEVQITSAEFTASAFINHRETVTVTLQSNCETRGTLVLYKDGLKSTSRVVVLSAGTNQQTLDLDTKVDGTFNYELRLEDLEKDTSDFNNSYTFTQMVASELKVLMLTNNWENCKALFEQYGNSAAIDLYENDSSVAIMNKSAFYRRVADNDKVNLYNFNLEMNANNAALYGVTVKNVPYTLEEISLYDQIVFADFDVRTLGDFAHRFINSVHTAVNSFGKSLITLGNTYIQEDNQDNALQILDSMLPVRFGRSDGAPKSYTIVIDQSYSLINSSRFNVAKEAATALIGLLDDSSYVSVVAFWNQFETIYGPEPLTNAAEVVARINALEPKQGTSILAPLQNVYERIKTIATGLPNGFSDKQIMLITDGEDYNDEARDQAEKLISDIYINDGFVTSVLNLGGAMDNESSGDSVYGQFLERLADLGHGNYYEHTSGADHLPDLIFGQMAEQEGNKVFTQDANVVVNKPADEVLDNISITGLPQVSGYVTSVARASAVTVLQIEHKREGRPSTNIPLYSYWSPGNGGKVASFTSALTGEWIKYWATAGLTEVFFDNVMDVNIPDQKSAYPYKFNVMQDGSAIQVRVTPDWHFGDTARIHIDLPGGDSVDQEMIWSGQYFYFDFSTSDVGKYEIEATYSYAGSDYKAKYYLNISYPSEYDEFTIFEASPLFRAINGRGQVIISGDLIIENDKDELGIYTQNLTFPLLLVAVVLFVVDIVVRKLKWEDVVSFFGGFKKPEGEKS